MTSIGLSKRDARSHGKESKAREKDPGSPKKRSENKFSGKKTESKRGKKKATSNEKIKPGKRTSKKKKAPLHRVPVKWGGRKGKARTEARQQRPQATHDRNAENRKTR